MFEHFILPSLIIALLLLLNGLFVAAEFAIVMSSTHELEQTATAVQKRWLNKLKAIKTSFKEQDLYIATAQLGITLSSLGLGMYGEHVLAEALLHLFEKTDFLHVLASHSIAGILAVAGLTYFHVVMGEMIPKSLAIQHAAKTVLSIAPFMFFFQTLMYPLVLLMNHTGNFLLKTLKLEGNASTESQTTLDDFHYIVEESEHAGLLSEETAEILQELLAFSDLKARDIMIPRIQVIGLPLNAPIEQIRSLLSQWVHSRYPVYQDNLDQIVGFVHVRDLLYLLVESQTQQTLMCLADRPQIIRALPFVPEASSLEDVLKVLQHSEVQMAGILDEYGGTAGILTLADICAQILDTSLGSTSTQAGLEVLPDGQVSLSGKQILSELNEFLPGDWEHPEIDTIGGLILFLLGRPPMLDDRVEYDRFEIWVTEIEGRGVKRCRIQVQDRN